MKNNYAKNSGLPMSEKVMASIWCRGPGVPNKILTPVQRLGVLFRKNADEPGNALFASAIPHLGECGIQLVELDMSEPDDIWPNLCPVCKTDNFWDMDGFYKTYPQYKSSELD